MFINNVYEFGFWLYTTTAAALIVAKAMRKLGEVPPGQELGRMKRDDCRCNQVFSCVCNKECECYTLEGSTLESRNLQQRRRPEALNADKGNLYEVKPPTDKQDTETWHMCDACPMKISCTVLKICGKI